jgi:MSHA biogenesis protein MshK
VIAVLVLALGWLSPAWGQALSDPTRPPQAWLATQQKAAGAAGAEQEVVPHLQSLLIAPSRRYAIVDGQLLGVGDTIGDARVVAVTPAGVRLRSTSGTRTLRLFPDVEKHPAKPFSADAAGAPAKAKRRIRLTETGNNVAKEKQ